MLFPTPKKASYCTLCEVVVQVLKLTQKLLSCLYVYMTGIKDLEDLGDMKTQKAIEEALDVVCTSLNLPVHKEYEKLVAKYTEEIISLLLQ